MNDFMKLKAVIWDMDGVLLDSEPFHSKAFRAIFDKYEMKVYEERLQRTFGVTNQQAIQLLSDEIIPKELIDRMCMEKDILFRQFLKEKTVFLPGVKKWMEVFKQNGIHQALASSSSPENIKVILTTLAAETFFCKIISGEGLPSKPDPAVFLKAASCLGIVPLNCLVIEDAVVGVQAAKAAGMKCVAVTTNNPVEKLADADVVLNNLTELTTDHILGLFSP